VSTQVYKEVYAQDVQRVIAEFERTITPISGLVMHSRQAAELLESGPVDFVIKAIAKTGRWAQRSKELYGNAPKFRTTFESILGGVKHSLVEARQRGLPVEQWVEPSLTVDDLRQAFQDRVAIYSLENWTITEDEAKAILDQHKPRTLLKAFDSVGQHVKEQRENNLVFLDQDSILDTLQHYLRRQWKPRSNPKHNA
jgi:hypothetical protein